HKPPVDDGVYVASLANGVPITPGDDAGDLYNSSWPPETLGATYMNFWIPGVILGMYCLGGVYRAAYQYLQRSHCSLYAIVMYCHVMLGFHFSNLRIVQLAIYAASATLFFTAVFGYRRSKADERWPAIGSERAG